MTIKCPRKGCGYTVAVDKLKDHYGKFCNRLGSKHFLNASMSDFKDYEKGAITDKELELALQKRAGEEKFEVVDEKN